MGDGRQDERDAPQTFHHQITHPLHHAVKMRCDQRSAASGEHDQRRAWSGFFHETHHALHSPGEGIDGTAHDRVRGRIGKIAERALLEAKLRRVSRQRRTHEIGAGHDDPAEEYAVLGECIDGQRRAQIDHGARSVKQAPGADQRRPAIGTQPCRMGVAAAHATLPRPGDDPSGIALQRGEGGGDDRVYGGAGDVRDHGALGPLQRRDDTAQPRSIAGIERGLADPAARVRQPPLDAGIAGIDGEHVHAAHSLRKLISPAR
jgi:hypothetical protein